MQLTTDDFRQADEMGGGGTGDGSSGDGSSGDGSSGGERKTWLWIIGGLIVLGALSRETNNNNVSQEQPPFVPQQQEQPYTPPQNHFQQQGSNSSNNYQQRTSYTVVAQTAHVYFMHNGQLYASNYTYPYGTVIYPKWTCKLN